MFEQLKNKILVYKINRMHLVSVNGKRKTFKTILSTSDWFANTDLGKEIINATSFLPDKYNIPFRLKCLFSDIYAIPRCPICGKDCIPLDRDLSIKFDCFSKTCANPVCKAKWSASFIVMTDKTRALHSKAQKHHKDIVRTKYKNLISIYLNNKYVLCSKTSIIEFYNERISIYKPNGKLIREKDLESNINLLCSVLYYSSGFIPVATDAASDNIDMSEFKFNERLYCISHNIMPPVCKYCNKNKVKFNNIIAGYSGSCPDCQADKCREKKGLKITSQILADIDQTKYELIQFPKHIGVDKLIVKCKKCGYISEWKSGCGMLQTLNGKKLCKNCEIFASVAEYEISEFIMSMCSNSILRNDRQLITPQELDIVIPDKNIAIEFDGFYYHSDDKVKPGYHVFKTQRCRDVGLDLIHIFENEWAFHRETVKNEIKRVFGINNKKDINSIRFSKIEYSEYSDFLKMNSLGINVKRINCMYYGLYDDNNLIAAFQACNRFRRNYDIYNMCVRNGFDIDEVSAAALNEFCSEFNPNRIRIFVDRRFTAPVYLSKSGFNFSHNTKIRGWWFLSGNFKHEFDMILDDRLSETEQKMYSAGYRRIFDCGDAVFVKQFN